MKSRSLFTLFTAILFVFVGLTAVEPVQAVNCENAPITGNYTLAVTGQSSCTFTNSGVDGVDAGTGSTNTAILTVPASVSLSVLNGQSIAAGSITITAGGAITIVAGGQLKPGSPIYATDADGDGYASQSVSQSLTGSTRRNTFTTVTDCGDGNANAKPGQTTYFTTSFNNTISGDTTSFDWNCDGSESKQYTTAPYVCSACTNGSGYASTINSSTGFATSSPACGVAGTYYTVSNATCRDPAVASCTGSYTTSSVTQPCR